jgi:hypothetical protein
MSAPVSTASQIPTSGGAAGASIRIFLVDGTSNGLRLVEKSNWTGLGIVCPRSEYGQARQRPEFDRPGVYVLVGPGGSALPQIYIGEGNELRDRLDSHQRGKDFWTWFVAFTSKDGNLNKAHVSHLESRLVGLATAAKRSEVSNGNAPTLPPLSEADTADVENFLREMLLICPVLEVSAFQISSTKESSQSAHAVAGTQHATLYLSGPETEATGTDAPEGFIVNAQSRGRLKTVPSMFQWLLNIRQSLMEQAILIEDGEQLVLAQDYAFDSPSSAAGVLLGRAANGRTEWKDAHGQTLKELQAQAVAAFPAAGKCP